MRRFLSIIIMPFLMPTFVFAGSNENSSSGFSVHFIGALPIPVIHQNAFCDNFKEALFDLQQNSNRTKSSEISVGTLSDELISKFRSGAIEEYIDIRALYPDQKTQEPRYISVAHILENTLKSDSSLIMALTPDELRYLPHVQQKSHILLITNTSEPLTPARAEAVAYTARRLQIKISILWTGYEHVTSNIENSESSSQAKGLAFIATLSGGVFIDLGGPRQPCADRS